MPPLAALRTLARPTNGLMASLGVVCGGLSAAESATHWGPLIAAALSAFAGVAGGNALNDALDARLDARAHPDRPVPRGLVTVREAAVASVVWFGLALGLAILCNLWVVLFASLLVLCLVAYETELKAQGLLGHLAVSYVVGGTFLLGALAASLGFLTYRGDAVRVLLKASTLLLPILMGLVALLANAARELYKSVQDSEHDRGLRWTLAQRWGGPRTLVLAGLLLCVSIPLAIVPALLDLVPLAYPVLIAPALVAFGHAAFIRNPDLAAHASRLTKVGMGLSLAAFLAVGLI